MNIAETKMLNGELTERLATSGFRFTPQRQHVYTVLLEKRDHPTAEEVFLRSKVTMPDISMATVYNCLDALVKCGLARQVHHDRSASRFCPNMRDHSHFYCDQCGKIYDIERPNMLSGSEINLPAGFTSTAFEISVRGVCGDCGSRSDCHPSL